MKDNGIVTIDGFDLSYRIEGEGIPVMVVGSAVYYPRLFSQQIRKELQLIFIDHRGFVKSPGTLEKEAYTLDKISDDIETIRQQLGLKDMVILGHSGHAFMALEYAKKYSQNVRKVVLLNSAPTNSEERQQQSTAYFNENAASDRKRMFEKDMALFQRDIEKEPERRFAHMLIRMRALSFYDYTFDGAYLWDGVYTNMPILDYLWGEAFAQLNMIDDLPGLDKPVFIGLGRYDYLVAPISLWDSIDERYPHIKKRVFDKSGHNPMLEEPDTFDPTLIRWIKENECMQII